jgi:molecular chaperone GrpE
MPTSPANDDRPSDAAQMTSAEPASEGEEVVALRAELEHAQDRHRRALADLDNYRKRMERETDRRVGDARQALLRDWLEAVDSVERALRMEPGDPGLIAVLEQMEAILAREGVVRLDAVGTRFDPQRHEAVGVQQAVDVPDQTIVEVARSGFGLDDGTILRPAQVVVSRRPAGQG